MDALRNIYYFSLVKGLIIALAFLVALNLGFGSYFWEYESFFNAMLIHEFSFPTRFDLSTNVYVSLLSLASFINRSLNTGLGLSLVVFLLNLVALSLIIAHLLFYLKLKKTEKSSTALLIIAALLLILPSKIVILNHYISILLAFAACLSLSTIQKYDLPKPYYLLVIGIVICSLLVRVEVASILYPLFLIYALQFNRALVKHAIIIFTLCISIQVIYHQALNKHEVYGAIFSFEHEIQDRQSVNFKDMKPQDWYKYQAMGKFIIDDTNYTIYDYKEYLKHQSRLDYLLTKTLFLEAYLKKLNNLSVELSSFVGHLTFILLLILFASIHYIKMLNIKRPPFSNSLLPILA